MSNYIEFFFSILFPKTFRIDDIEDNSCLRRGVPVAHSIYGVASTINAANYVFFLALEKVQHLGHADVSGQAFRLRLDQYCAHKKHFHRPFRTTIGNKSVYGTIVGIASRSRYGDLLAR